MTDEQNEQLSKHPAVVEAAKDIVAYHNRIIAAAVAKVCEQARYHCDQGIGRADNFLAGLAAANNRGHVFVMIDAIRTDIVEARAALPQPREVSE
jgi:hypothetical protein